MRGKKYFYFIYKPYWYYPISAALIYSVIASWQLSGFYFNRETNNAAIAIMVLKIRSHFC